MWTAPDNHIEDLKAIISDLNASVAKLGVYIKKITPWSIERPFLAKGAKTLHSL